MNDNMGESKTVPFYDKNYTFITDSTSNSGSFSSGQIQFDLSTLNSQSQWISLNEGIIEFPVKVTAQVTAAGGSPTTANLAGINTAIIKNGWHQFIDGCQLIINGQTIQSTQPYENVAATFRILSTWSQDTLKKWGTSTGVALDDCTADSVNTISNTNGLGNASTGHATAVRGFDAVNNQGTLHNKGVAARAMMTNNNIGSTTTPAGTLQATILGTASMKNAGRSNVTSVFAGSNTANAYIYSAYYMATVRLRDLCDINDFPLVKNLKGYLYLTFNASQINLTSTVGATTIASVSVNPINGRTCPILVNAQATTGLVMGNVATTATSVQIVASVDATQTTLTGSVSEQCGPLLTTGRLLVPYYLANPRTDSALSQSNKFFTTMEKIVNPITCVAGSSVNYTISVGVPNPRKLLLLPMWQNLGNAGWLSNPETSCFDTVPATSGPFAQLNNLQVYVANKPLYQNPIQYDFEQWNNENSELGLNGNNVNEQTSGLLSEQLWTQNHRFYYVDLSRRMESEDGSSKSVQVSFQNPSSGVGLKVIAIVFYERQYLIDTSTCMLQNIK
jgi:hypothetical protein